MKERLSSWFIAHAQESKIKLNLPDNIRAFNNGEGWKALIASVTELILAFLALAAFVGILYSGVMMITAGDDPAKFAAGKKNLIWSIIGIIVVMLAYFIVKFIYTLTGNIIGEAV
jgi:type IV secretory pathway VirB2 component (pilin)